MAPMMRIAFEKIESVQETGAKPSYGIYYFFQIVFKSILSQHH